MVFISKLTLGASKTLHAKMLFTAAFVILTLNIPRPGLWMARPAPLVNADCPAVVLAQPAAPLHQTIHHHQSVK